MSKKHLKYVASCFLEYLNSNSYTYQTAWDNWKHETELCLYYWEEQIKLGDVMEYLKNIDSDEKPLGYDDQESFHNTR